MCLIVDNDVAHRVFLKPDDPDFKYVFGCLFGKRLPGASIVYGGKLTAEYLGNTALIAPLLELKRVGWARSEQRIRGNGTPAAPSDRFLVLSAFIPSRSAEKSR